MFILENTNIWECLGRGAIGIPTNGYINRNGAGVMGAGLALDAKTRYPGIEYDLGTLLKREGNVVGWIRRMPDLLIAVPVKPCFLDLKTKEDKAKVLPKARHIYNVGDTVPGYHCKADLNLIESSLNQLVAFGEKFRLDKIFIPLLGCGNGGLSAPKNLFPLLKRLDLPNFIVLVINTRQSNG